MLMRTSDDGMVHDSPADQTPVERAEEMLALMERRVGPWLSTIRFGILQRTARVREEAEDVWAEAQSIRQANARQVK